MIKKTIEDHLELFLDLSSICITLRHVWPGISHVHFGRQFGLLIRVHMLRPLDSKRGTSHMFERTYLRVSVSEVTALLCHRLRSLGLDWLNAGATDDASGY